MLHTWSQIHSRFCTSVQIWVTAFGTGLSEEKEEEEEVFRHDLAYVETETLVSMACTSNILVNSANCRTPKQMHLELMACAAKHRRQVAALGVQSVRVVRPRCFD